MGIPLFDIKDTGTVKEIKKGIVCVERLYSCINGQIVEIGSDLKGMVFGFDKEEVLVLTLGDETSINIGDTVYTKEGIFQIPVGNNYIGRIVDIFGQPLDGKAKIEESDFYPIFQDAPGVLDRVPINEQLLTGIKTIDTVIPIGKGQRELIVGDRVTGKTSLVTDAIINQKDKKVVCIYCWIGGSQSALIKVVEDLKRSGAMDYTIIISASARSSIAEQYLVPYAASALGEYFRDHAQDVLVAFDNLSRHAWIYREISLLLERPPGREAYPGDIFYIHSQLMERAGKLNQEHGGGSMTFLPIVETQEGDITGLIPSNIISMTDGQIYLSPDLFNDGFRPAIDLGLSVSRIGSKVQSGALKEVSCNLKREYSLYEELVGFTKIKTKLSSDMELKLERGKLLRELFIQSKGHPVSLEEVIIIFYVFNNEILQSLKQPDSKYFKEGFFKYLVKNYSQLIEQISIQKMLTSEVKKNLNEAFKEFIRGK